VSAGEREGVVKYAAAHRSDPLSPQATAASPALLASRAALLRLGFLGSDPARYEGLGYGNVSCRLPPYGAPRRARSFLVTGSQTAHLAEPSLALLAEVEAYDLGAGRICSRGAVAPSSEALSHAAFYDVGIHVRWVIHAHSPELWRAAADALLGRGVVWAEGAYGSQTLAQEIGRQWRQSTLSERGWLAMAGHQDGVMSFGRSAQEALTRLLEAWQVAVAALMVKSWRR